MMCYNQYIRLPIILKGTLHVVGIFLLKTHNSFIFRKMEVKLEGDWM